MINWNKVKIRNQYRCDEIPLLYYISKKNIIIIKKKYIKFCPICLYRLVLSVLFYFNLINDHNIFFKINASYN